MSTLSTSIRIRGRVTDRATGAGLPGLLVKAWDRDLLFNDLLGSAPTDADGFFSMSFDESYFRELFFDRRPDVFFEIFYRGRCVYTTKGDTYYNVKVGESEFNIAIDRSILGDEPGQEPPKQFPDPRQFGPFVKDDPVNRGPRVTPPADTGWRDKINDWWKARKEQRRADGTLHIPERPIPRPYLDCTSNFGPQLHTLGLNEPGEMKFTVWNDGNFPAWTCYVELYEGPSGYSSPLSAYEFRGRRIITLQPGERRDVSVPWVRRMESARVVGIVFDPLLDPRDFTLVAQHNRHITSIHYGGL